MSIYVSRGSYQADLTPRFRDLKLKLISDNFNFEVSKDTLKKYYNDLLFIKKEFPNDIITGSIALSLLGLINRDIGDIDILIKDVNRYSGYNNYNYGDEKKGIENRLGFIRFKFNKGLLSRTKTYEVDFFKDLGTTYIEFQFEDVILKLQHPLEIVSAKMGMSRHHKHYRDLEIIFNKFDV